MEDAGGRGTSCEDSLVEDDAGGRGTSREDSYVEVVCVVPPT